MGSSATTTSGSLIVAMAITARCRIPPEYSCGYARALRTASGIPTRSSAATARARASLREAPATDRHGGGELVAHGVHGGQGREGVLRDEGDTAATLGREIRLAAQPYGSARRRAPAAASRAAPGP